MPVRFRCHYCNQLLGIAHRKVGMEVSCPTCRKTLVVPATDSPDVDRPAPRMDPLFEGSELDALLQPAAVAPAPLPPPQQPAPPVTAPVVFDVEPLNVPTPAAPPGGVVLSPVQATMLAVGAVIVLAVAFFVGLLIGRFVL